MTGYRCIRIRKVIPELVGKPVLILVVVGKLGISRYDTRPFWALVAEVKPDYHYF